LDIISKDHLSFYTNKEAPSGLFDNLIDAQEMKNSENREYIRGFAPPTQLAIKRPVLSAFKPIEVSKPV
jgi:hypothetical protein